MPNESQPIGGGFIEMIAGEWADLVNDNKAQVVSELLTNIANQYGARNGNSIGVCIGLSLYLNKFSVLCQQCRRIRRANCGRNETFLFHSNCNTVILAQHVVSIVDTKICKALFVLYPFPCHIRLVLCQNRTFHNTIKVKFISN